MGAFAGLSGWDIAGTNSVRKGRADVQCNAQQRKVNHCRRYDRDTYLQQRVFDIYLVLYLVLDLLLYLVLYLAVLSH